jgi:hypothetical protein
LGLALPFSIVRYTYKEYEAVNGGIEANKAEELLKDRLLQWVLKESGGAKLSDAQFNVETADGCLTVSVLAECYEQIGVTRFY